MPELIPAEPGTHWECLDCGWHWPLAGKPPEYAACDNCGDELEEEPDA